MPLGNTLYATNSANLCVKSTTTLVTPTVIEDPLWPQANLLTSDRYQVWKCPVTSATSVDVVFDFGASKTVTAIGVLGMHRVPGGLWPIATAWASSTDNTTWTSAINVSCGGVDAVACAPAVAVPWVGRYLRCRFNNTNFSGANGFSVGKLFAATTMNDIGVAYAPGSTEATVQPNSRVRLLDGHEVVTSYGSTRRVFSMQFPASNDARRNTIRSLSTLPDPFVLVPPDRTACECRAIADTFTSEAVWGVVGAVSGDLWNCALDIESLP